MQLCSGAPVAQSLVCLDGMVGRSLRGSLYAAVSAFALLLAAPAATAQVPAQPVEFRIAAQPLSTALLQLAAQARLTVVFPETLTAGIQAKTLNASLPPAEALTQLLAGTNLKFEFLSSTSVRVSAREVRGEAPAPRPVPVRAAAATPPAEELVVVGSRLQSAGQGPLPVVSISRAAIDASGAESLAQVLNNLPQASIRSTQMPQQNPRGNSTINLRGLPSGTTLTLLDGRKLGGSAYQSSSGLTNLNLLPLALVERVEVLAGGSSAVYGGDALAGVVNIVLKKELDGGAVDVRYGSADSFQQRQYNAAWGTRFDRGSLTLTAEYDSNPALSARHRSLTADTDFRDVGGVLVASPINAPAIYSLNGQAIPGLGATNAAIPAGTTGIGLTRASFLPTAGRPSGATDFYEQLSNVPPVQQYGGMVYGTFELTSGVELYANAFYTHRFAEERDFPLFVQGQAGSVVIPAANPFNPFGVPLGLNYVFKGAGSACYCLTQEYGRGLAGARGEIRGWKWDVGVTYARSVDHSDVEGPNLDSAKLNAALADTNPATAFNPFADRIWTPAEAALFNPHIKDTSKSSLATVDFSARGVLWDLPTGPVKMLLGGEYDYAKIGYIDRPTVVTANRRVMSAFGELRIPLLGPSEEGKAERVALSGAVRYDNYSDFGSRLSPQAGLEARPMDGVLLRAGYSGAYKPPTLYQIENPVINYSSQTYRDPKRNETYIVNYQLGGNRDLQPMTGDTWSFGFVLQPKILGGLEISASKWTLSIKNYVNRIAVQTMIDNEPLFQQYIFRNNTTGRIDLVRSVTLNYGTFNIAGVDLSMRWPISTEWGQFVPAAATTNTYRYNAALLPGTTVVQRANKANTGGYAPKWKSQVSLGWNTDYVDATVVGNHVGAYRDYGASNLSLGNFWTADANARIQVGRAFSNAPRGAKDAYLTVGVRNMFNRLPDYSTYGTIVGYDPTQYDIVGRYLYLQVGTRF